MYSRTPPGPPNGPLKDTDGNREGPPTPHPLRSRRSILSHAGATLVGALVGVLIGVTSSPGSDKAAPSTTVTVTATTTENVSTTPGAEEPPASSSSSEPFAFGDTLKLKNNDPARPFEGTLTVLDYKQGFTSVGKANEESGSPGYVWAYADLKLCAVKGSYTDNSFSWTLYYSNGSRIRTSGTTYGDFPKPEYPTEVTVTAGKCARGKLVFPVPGSKRPQSVLYGPDGLEEPKEWTVPKA